MTFYVGDTMKHKLPELQYDYTALEPYIDAKTMEIHYTKHHQTYIDKLLAALQDSPELMEKSVEELLTNTDTLPENIKQAIINNGGGHYNHTLFWSILSPNTQECEGLIKEKIDESFGSYDEFVAQFTQAALTRFGSGWAWLVVNEKGTLEILSTANQDTPLSIGKTPILGLDVWEHAYYLQYQNRRPEYVEKFFSHINWEKVTQLLENAQ